MASDGGGLRPRRRRRVQLHARPVRDGRASAYPNRVIVGSETYPVDDRRRLAAGRASTPTSSATSPGPAGTTSARRASAGSSTRDATAERPMSAFHGPYPWLLAGCGDIDITGHRRPQSYYREIVFGLRADPYIAVQRPEHHDDEIGCPSSPWSWTDAVSSWSWAGSRGRARRRRGVRRRRRGRAARQRPVARPPSATGPANRYRAEFETAYQPGELVAVGYTRRRGDRPHGPATRRGSRGARGRRPIEPRSGPTRPTSPSSRSPSSTATATRDTTADRPVTVAIDGPAVLQGFGTGQPDPTETFADATRHDVRRPASR